MADDRYLDGDPRQESVSFLDTSDFVAAVHQELGLIADLIEAKRYPEAWECATGYKSRAASILRTLEKPTLPAVDLDKTPDVGRAARRVYKQTP